VRKVEKNPPMLVWPKRPYCIEVITDRDIRVLFDSSFGQKVLSKWIIQLVFTEWICPKGEANEEVCIMHKMVEAVVWNEEAAFLGYFIFGCWCVSGGRANNFPKVFPEKVQAIWAIFTKFQWGGVIGPCHMLLCDDGVRLKAVEKLGLGL